MLKITIPAAELFDSVDGFIYTNEQTIQLEHSLVSLSKWESKWHKPYLSKQRKTVEESRDYVRCMTLTQNVDPNVYLAIMPEIFRQVNAYIDLSFRKISERKNGLNKIQATWLEKVKKVRNFSTKSRENRAAFETPTQHDLSLSHIA